MPTHTVEQLWRYPVKSMLGERLPAAELTDVGILGDRGWAVRDEVRGGIRGAKKIAGLTRFAARYATEPTPEAPTPDVEITAPDGTSVETSADGADKWLSDALGHEVTLWARRPADDLEHYLRGRPDSDDLMTELRDIFGRLPDEPLPDLTGFPPEIFQYESPPGTYFDAFPIHLVTTASLRTLADLAPDSDVDVRRFRPNLVVDVDGEGLPELEWLGRHVSVGGAMLRVTVACPRCSVVTRPTGELPQDRDLLRSIVRDLDQNLGVYAEVVTPGTVSTGDAVVVHES